jgi:small subunit ribosomal protein S20
MANLSGSIKRARQTIKRNKHNSQIRTKTRTFIKKVTYALQDGKKDQAQDNFKVMQKIIDQAVSKGLMHKNKAARKKSRINSQIKML